MSSYPKLNFPAVKLRASRRGERTLVWDDLRAMWLVLTPEEWVRRHLIAYLETGCGAARRRIVQEYPVAMNGAPQRADVVVVDDDAQPLVLCECKAPEIPIDRHVLQLGARRPLSGADQRSVALLLRTRRRRVSPVRPLPFDRFRHGRLRPCGYLRVGRNRRVRSLRTGSS